MPSPINGKPGSAVLPAEPLSAFEADNAEPGELERIKGDQRRQGTGKYGTPHAKPHKPDLKKTGWIEIVLVDEEDQPVPGEWYRITLPDGETVAQGTLDERGFARIEGIDLGMCQVTFPNLDKAAWKEN